MKKSLKYSIIFSAIFLLENNLSALALDNKIEIKTTDLKWRNKVKKIQILESNNNYMIDNSSFIIKKDDFEDLKAYVLSKINLKKYSEPEIFSKTLEWVSTRWTHDGLNSGDDFSSLEILKNVEKGERYRCVEYGKVFSDILSSLGYYSRSLGLMSIDVAYGDYGKGHVASEVWSNELNKWVFFDPQFCIYTTYNNNPLNFYEIYQLFKDNKYDDIKFIIPDSYLTLYIKNNSDRIKNKEDYINQYKDFLKNYFGAISISKKIDGDKFNLVLKLDNKEDFITFQGQPYINNIFTNKVEDLYFKLNQTMVIFSYKEEEMNRIKELEKTIQIKTLEDLIKNKHLFYANPNFNLKFKNNFTDFSHYEVYVNDKKYELKNDSLELFLEEGIYSIITKGISKFGISGAKNYIKVSYN
ncbi:MAG: hypothetical protein U0457_00900 [Candidatus Sericytochromatia bacterium]